MEQLEIERRLERIERLLRVTAEETSRLRTSVGMDMSSNERWARMMGGVLSDLDAAGGEVSRRDFLELGEKHGYSRRGMAGFYPVLVEPTPNGKTRLTEAGRDRLASLRHRYPI